MVFLRKLLDFYIDTSIHVGFAVTCLTQITLLEHHLKQSCSLTIATFFGTIIGYNFLKYGAFFASHVSLSFRYYAILLVSLISVVGFAIAFWQLPYAIQKAIVASGLAVMGYPFLRKFGGLKLFVVSLVVTYITVSIPFNNTKIVVQDIQINFVQRFLLLSSLLIPFEILDSKTDAPSLQTLPQQFGVYATKLFGILLVFSFLFLECLKVKTSILVFPIGLITLLAISFSSTDQHKYYTSFWVESIPIFWWLFLVVFK